MRHKNASASQAASSPSSSITASSYGADGRLKKLVDEMRMSEGGNIPFTVAVDESDDPIDSRSAYLRMTANRPSTAAMILLANLLVVAWQKRGYGSPQQSRSPSVERDGGDCSKDDECGAYRAPSHTPQQAGEKSGGGGVDGIVSGMPVLESLYILALQITASELGIGLGRSLVTSFSEMAFPPIPEDEDGAGAGDNVSTSSSHQSCFERPLVRKGKPISQLSASLCTFSARLRTHCEHP
jgi:hypothetical protein